MCKLLIVKGGSDILYYNTVCDDNGFCLGEVSGGYSKHSVVYRLYIDEEFNIHLPLDGDLIIQMAPLPKALYLLFLRHPSGILLKKIGDYREELEFIYRTISSRKNPTVIRRMLNDITNPMNNVLNKNLSIIRAAFLKQLPPDVAQQFFPIRGRTRVQYVILDTSYIKMPENL